MALVHDRTVSNSPLGTSIASASERTIVGYSKSLRASLPLNSRRPRSSPTRYLPGVLGMRSNGFHTHFISTPLSSI